MNIIDFYEVAGSVSGLVGAVMVASHTRFSPYGWMLFLVSSVMLVLFSFQLGKYWLLVQQFGFAAINVLGLVRAFQKKDE